jgi:hypothetical protein
VGLFSVVIVQPLGNLLFHLQYADVNELENLARISFFDSDVLVQEYSRLNKEKDLLYGSVLAFFLIGVGGLSEIRNLPELKRTVVLGVFAAWLISASALYVGTQKRYLGNEMIQAASKVESEFYQRTLDREVRRKAELQKSEGLVPEK